MSTAKKLQELNKKYVIVCNEYVQVFCHKQKIDFDYWVADEVGGIACFASQYFFNLSDIILDLNTEQPKGFILDWQNDSTDIHFKYPEVVTINYKSYTMGLRY